MFEEYARRLNRIINSFLSFVFLFFFSLRIRAIGPTLDAKLSNLRWIISSTRICDCTDANKCTRPWQLTLNFE